MRKSMISIGLAIIVLVAGSFYARAGGTYSQTSTIVYTTDHATTTHTFTNIPGAPQHPPSDGTLTVSVRGDYNSSSEYADVYVEGTIIGTNQGPAIQCDSNWETVSFTVTSAQLSAWAADGQIVVEVRNSSDVGYFCSYNQHQVTITYSYGDAKNKTKPASILPLANTNMVKASNLQTEANSLLSQAQSKGLDTSTCEKMINEATELLKKAKKSMTNPPAANYFALQAIEKLKSAIECLKTLLG